MGADAAKAIEGLLESVSKPADGHRRDDASASSLLLIGATTVFGELQDALDRIWRAPARERSGGWWTLLRARLLSFGMILGIAFLLMVSLVLGAAHLRPRQVVGRLLRRLGDCSPRWSTSLVGFALTAGVFAMIYKLMPRVQVQLARRLARSRS